MPRGDDFYLKERITVWVSCVQLRRMFTEPPCIVAGVRFSNSTQVLGIAFIKWLSYHQRVGLDVRCEPGFHIFEHCGTFRLIVNLVIESLVDFKGLIF